MEAGVRRRHRGDTREESNYLAPLNRCKMRAVPGVLAQKWRNSNKFPSAVESRRIMETWWVSLASPHLPLRHKDTKNPFPSKTTVTKRYLKLRGQYFPVFPRAA